MARYNDLDMNNWKEYEDILTDSLWIFDKRDKSGVHNASYHGICHLMFFSDITDRIQQVQNFFVEKSGFCFVDQRVGYVFVTHVHVFKPCAEEKMSELRFIGRKRICRIFFVVIVHHKQYPDKHAQIP